VRARARFLALLAAGVTAAVFTATPAVAAVNSSAITGHGDGHGREDCSGRPRPQLCYHCAPRPVTPAPVPPPVVVPVSVTSPPVIIEKVRVIEMIRTVIVTAPAPRTVTVHLPVTH
jgi:hypothetical protein